MLARAYVESYPEEVNKKKVRKVRKVRKVKKNKVKNKNKISAKQKKHVSASKNKEVNPKIALRTFTLLSVFAIMSLFLIFLIGHSNITKTRMEVNQLETYKEDLKKIKIDLTADLEGIKSSAKIGEDAMYILGMTYPEDDQVVYISVSDEISKDVAGTNNIALTGIGKVFSFITGLF